MRLREWSVIAAMLMLAACASSGGPVVQSVTPVKSSKRESPSELAENKANSVELMVQLGQGYLQQGKLDLARDKLQKAIRLDPKNVNANTMMGVLNERINRPEIAEKFYRKAVQFAPEDGNVNNNLGSFLCGSGRPAEADAWFAKALNDPFYKTPQVALSNAGVCAIKAGNTARAEEYFRRVLELQPQHAVALYELARLNVARGDYLRARAFQQRLEASNVDSPEVLELGAEIESKLGNAKGAASYQERLKRDFPDYQPAPQASTGQQR
jgi:type IV pilus assembly protein PilF